MIKRKELKYEKLLFFQVKKALKNLQEQLCFVPMDKNASTWCILCLKLYKDLHRKEFGNKEYYKIVSLTKSEV